MKTRITFFAVFLTVFFRCSAQSQVPNGGFENWVNAVTPNHWTSLESLLAIDTSILTFKDTIDFFQGLSSIKLVTDSIPQEPTYGLVSAETSLGTLTLGTHNNQIYAGYPFTSMPDSFIFEYEYTSPGNDTGYAKIIMTLGGDTTILSAGISLPQASAWTSVALPLDGYYNYIMNPDTLLIQFKSSHAARPVKGSTLHIDAVRFGYAAVLVNSFQATIAPAGTTIICSGDSVIYQANPGLGETYQWNLNGFAIAGATGQSFVAKTGGSYTVQVDSSGVISTSMAATLVVDTLVASIIGLNDTVCSNAGAISLTGGSPAGGTYSGSGVTGSTFTPQSAALGVDTIVYTATDANHCTGSASATITVNQASVSLTGLDDTICNNANAITLSGGSPAGGTYSGNGVSGSTFTPQLVSPGLDTIIYVATDANHCTGLAGATIYVEVCGGINSISAANISIYPNPAMDLLNINSNQNLAGLNARMYDAFGRLVINQLLEESNNAINVSRLAEGIYIYRISDRGNAAIAQGKFNVVK